MLSYAEILIIDDMPDQISLVSSYLLSEGYRVFATTSTCAVRRFFEKRLPDLILLDIQMGDVSGLEICRRIKENERLSDIPIIFLTSETSLEIISESFELGGCDYVKKPFIKEEFLARIKTQLRLSSQRKELVAANEELTQFCSAVTHDLKAPFTVVNQLIGMLQNELAGNESETVSQIMELITGKASQTKIMIERLFEFSRMCNVDPVVKEVDVEAIAYELFEDFRLLEPNRTVEFNCEHLPRIIADETLVRMAMKNLLQNAFKYSSKKEKTIISISSLHDRNYYVIRVRDNGAGFDMQYAHKLFQVFERLHREEEFHGTGVGLALVNRIMHRHNGRIEAYGEVDKGAEFTLFFPKSVKATV